MDTDNARSQLNVRITPNIAKLIDAKRIDLSKEMGNIPTRSDVLRFALADYLGLAVGELGVDGRKAVKGSSQVSG